MYKIDENRLDSGLEGSLSEIEAIHSKINALSDSLIRSICLKHLDFGTEQIDAHEAFVARLTVGFDYAKEIVAIRLRNRESVLADYDYTLISLGYDCFPRTISTKMGLMLSRSEGTLTCPFDLCVHPLRAVGDLLSNDFASYDEADAYHLDGRGLAVHRRLSITFNHDRDANLFENDFEGLRELYKRRAKNFREYAGRNNAVFLLKLSKRDYGHFGQFHASFREHFPSKPLLVICEAPLDNASACVDPKLFEIPAGTPSGEYRWFAADDFATERGKAYEFPIADRIVEVIRNSCHLKARDSK